MPEPTTYREAQPLYRTAGWTAVLPVAGKELVVKGVTGRQRQLPTDDHYHNWTREHPEHNVAVALPPRMVGIDIDAYAGKAGGATLAKAEGLWGQLPPTWRTTARSDGQSGIRLFWLPEEAELVANLDELAGTGIDVIQFHHRYAVVWPSIHPELQQQVRWIDPQGRASDRVPQPGEMAQLPHSWFEALQVGQNTAGGSTPQPAAPRSTLAALLDAPPAQGGRNQWLTRVAGHLAKELQHEDGFQSLLLTISRSLDAPLPPEETLKVARSIWESEQHTQVHAESFPKQSTGWLASGGDHLACLVRVGEKGNKSTQLATCSDFDIQVISRYQDGEQRWHYHLRIDRDGTPEPTLCTVPADLFGDPRALAKWMAGYQLHAWPVEGDLGGLQGRPAARLGQYLASQDATALQITPHLGWQDEAQGFVCEEGVITGAGLQKSSEWVPDPQIRKRDPHVHRYGFEHDWDTAQAVLREVLTFQDHTVASVFGAWWAACLIKGQLMNKTSLFPIMAIEATSGTGKSTGFFNMMVRLNGARRLGSKQTAAVFRDALASNRSGIVWLDDLDDPTKLYQHLRLCSAEEELSKKGYDWFGSTSTRLVAPALLSGESLPGLNKQLALTDRTIQLSVPPVQERRSCRGDYAQWDDIIALRERYPDMTMFAGWYVQHALSLADDVVSQWGDLRIVTRGRVADKFCALRVGARLLDRLTDSGWHAETVDAWCDAQEINSDDYLVSEILPKLLRLYNVPSSAKSFPPAFADEDGTVWWHLGQVADAWQREARSMDERARGFADQDVLQKQRVAMGITKEDRKGFRVTIGDRTIVRFYHPVPEDASARIMAQVEGA